MEAALQFTGSHLNPSAISSGLGVSATTSGRLGEPIYHTLRNGNRVSRPASSGYWFLEIPAGSTAELRAGVAALLDAASPDCVVWRGLSEQFSGCVLVQEVEAGLSDRQLLGAALLLALRTRGLAVRLSSE